MKQILCLVVLFNILVNFNPSFAIRCYMCEDELGQGLHCESNVKSVLQPNCTEGFHCLKYTWTANTTTLVHRGCAPRSKCEELKASLPSLKYCGTCDNQLCNAARRTKISILSLILATVLISMCSLKYHSDRICSL